MTAPTTVRPQLLFIVSRERVDLYDTLRRTCSEESDYEVIIDRRAGARRAGARRGSRPPGGKDRRTRHRREHLLVDSEIRGCGWAMVKLDT